MKLTGGVQCFRDAVYIIRGSCRTFLCGYVCVCVPLIELVLNEGMCVYHLSCLTHSMRVGSPGLTPSWSSPFQVFLREAERQRLQAELHREVLRLIVMLQQRFRARLERKQFVRMREAAVCIQVNLSIISDLIYSRSAFTLSLCQVFLIVLCWSC